MFLNSKPDFEHDSNSKFIRDIGLRIFSDGNLSSTHTTFPTEHICNMFCKFFKLPSPSAWELLNTMTRTNQREEGEIVEADSEIIN
jgi:hypothetical protein